MIHSLTLLFRLRKDVKLLREQAGRGAEECQTLTMINEQVNYQHRRNLSSNLLMEAFSISSEGHFGTINGFRLGRLAQAAVSDCHLCRMRPDQQLIRIKVGWNEVNAAWGYAAHLLDELARQAGYTFSSFRIIVNGSSSRLERIQAAPSSTREASSTPSNVLSNALSYSFSFLGGGKTEKSAASSDTLTPPSPVREDQPVAESGITSYELYGSGDMSLGKLFWNRRFDHAMVVFLHLMQQLAKHYQQNGFTLFQLPHRYISLTSLSLSQFLQFS